MEELPEQFGAEASSPYLQQPITKKSTLVGKGKVGGKEIRWGLSSMQGWRVTMEDAHAHSLPIRSDPDAGFFGVFDGHGGDLAAKYAAANVLSYIEESEAYQDFVTSGSKDGDEKATALAKAIMEGFIDCDESLKDHHEVKSGVDFSGSTGVCCMVTETHLIFGNTGDSRAVLFANNKAKFGTKDQKPSDPEEEARVRAAGGTVTENRVNGDLASARSFGDFRYKLDEHLPPSKQQITVLPETTIIPRTDDDQYVLLACDGIWDVMSNFEATQLVLAAMKLGCGIGTACEKLLDECLMKSSGDNMSVLIICFPGAPKEIGKAKPGREPSVDVIRETMVGAEAGKGGQSRGRPTESACAVRHPPTDTSRRARDRVKGGAQRLHARNDLSSKSSSSGGARMARPGQTLAKKHIYTAKDYPALLDEPEEIMIETVAPFVSRITLNQPEEGNRMSFVMRAQLLNQLQINDQDPDVRVTIVRATGSDFCLGQDVARSKGVMPFFTDESDGQVARNALMTWFAIMDLAKPVIAEVQGGCLGSGMELAAACDILYCADDARFGYPEGRNMGLPDMQVYPWLCGMRNALSIMLQAETFSGEQAVQMGFATRSIPVDDLEASVLGVAQRVAKIPADLLAYNKRSVHRAFEAQGMRTSLRHG
ncbi:Protein phosphatase 1B (Protein phosphatase 2C isoform beta) (PP2C-beta), partial [Durusdinium trenchii]